MFPVCHQITELDVCGDGQESQVSALCGMEMRAMKEKNISIRTQGNAVAVLSHEFKNSHPETPG